MVEEIVDFHNRFTIEKIIGAGSYGIVELVRGKRTGRYFALKRMQLSMVNVRSVNAEWGVSQKLKGECAVPNYHDRFIMVYQGIRWYCFLMDYVKGISIKDYIKMYMQSQTFIEEGDMINFMLSSLRGLACMHAKNIVHRDIKPDNMLYRDNKIVYIDLGFSCFTTSSNAPVREKCTKNLMGTPRFYSPEEILALVKFEETDMYKKSDVWSLGAVFYYLANRKYAFDGTNLAELKQQIKGNIRKPSSHPSKLVNQIIEMMLTLEFARRPDAIDVLEFLEKMTKRTTISAKLRM